MEVNLPLLRKVEFLQGLGEGIIEGLVGKLQLLPIVQGEYIFYEGQVSTRMFVINRGIAHVMKNGIRIAKLHEGDYFGELSLLVKAPRTADVIAATDVILQALSVEDFLAVLSRDPQATAKVKALAEERQIQMGITAAAAETGALNTKNAKDGAGPAVQKKAKEWHELSMTDADRRNELLFQPARRTLTLMAPIRRKAAQGALGRIGRNVRRPSVDCASVGPQSQGGSLDSSSHHSHHSVDGAIAMSFHPASSNPGKRTALVNDLDSSIHSGRSSSKDGDSNNPSFSTGDPVTGRRGTIAARDRWCALSKVVISEKAQETNRTRRNMRPSVDITHDVSRHGRPLPRPVAGASSQPPICSAGESDGVQRWDTANVPVTCRAQRCDLVNNASFHLAGARAPRCDLVNDASVHGGCSSDASVHGGGDLVSDAGGSTGDASVHGGGSQDGSVRGGRRATFKGERKGSSRVSRRSYTGAGVTGVTCESAEVYADIDASNRGALNLSTMVSSSAMGRLSQMEVRESTRLRTLSRPLTPPCPLEQLQALNIVKLSHPFSAA